MRSMIWLGLALAGSVCAAAEVTVKNDSLESGTGLVIPGFVTGEMAASWLTSPCDGNIVAAQVFWSSGQHNTAPIVEDAVKIYRSGTFPTPGDLAQNIGGPQLTDSVMNEFRYLDENNTVPLIVPVSQNETFVLALSFAEDTDPGNGPSVVVDADGITPNRNAIYQRLAPGVFSWTSSSTFLVPGDWVLRAVVNCSAVSNEASVATNVTSSSTAYIAGAPLQYTITVANSGPASASSTNVIDIFPSGFTSATWTCAASGSAACAASGAGNITQTVSLPNGGQVVYTVNGTVSASATGTLSNSATAIVNAPATDPNSTDNTATLDLEPAVSDVIFANGFDAPADLAPPRIVRSRALGMAPAKQ